MKSVLSFLWNTEDVSDKLLAFRTITTMLGGISRIDTIDVQDNLLAEPDPAAREEVKVLDAFSHLIVGQHGVAAMATNRVHFDGTKLRVIVCVNSMPLDKAVPLSPLSSIVSQLRSIVTRNPRKENFKDITFPSFISPPQIISAEQPGDLNGRDALKYIQDLHMRWKEVNLEQHLWIISNLLSLKTDQGSLPSDLTRYVVAVSYKSMIRRFKHENLSMPFYESLTSIPQSKLADIRRKQQESSEPGVDFPSMSTPSSVPKDPRRTLRETREKENDILFLKEVVSLFPFKTQIPKIKELSERASSGAQNVQLYTDETRAEFHELLVELLNFFKASLLKLDVPPAEEKFDKDFASNMMDICKAGYALLRVSRGRAVQLHLESIQKELKDPRIPIAGIPDSSRANFEVIQGKTKLQAYMAWMRLMVGHFDVVEIIFHFFSRRHFRGVPISIKILAAPPASESLLSWDTIFRDYLPQTTSKERRDCSNQKLKEFLKKMIDSTPDNQKIRHAIDTARISVLSSQSINSAPFKEMAEAKNEGVKKLATSLLKKVKSSRLNKTSSYRAEISQGLDEIEKIVGVETFRDRFFLNLGNKDLKFKGTLHCETCLASLLSPNVAKKGKDVDGARGSMEIPAQLELEGYGRVIGVSKHCCPVCAKFLEYLSRDIGRTIVIRGNHGTITPCTLPPWTPENVVNEMIEYYARMLREDLVALYFEYQDRSLSRVHCTSAGSETLSVNSVDGRVRTLNLDFYEDDEEK